MSSQGKYQLLPPLTGKEYEGLRQSIEQYGYDPAHPVVVDEDGEILDGHHRAQIAASLGIEAPTVERKGLPEHEKIIYALEANLNRRTLTKAQRLQAYEALKPAYAARARARILSTQNNEAGKATKEQLGANAHGCEEEQGKARDLAAEKAGVGAGTTAERQLKRLAQLRKDAPDLAAKIDSGDMDLDDANREFRNRTKSTEPTVVSVDEDGVETVIPGAVVDIDDEDSPKPKKTLKQRVQEKPAQPSPGTNGEALRSFLRLMTEDQLQPEDVARTANEGGPDAVAKARAWAERLLAALG